LYCCLAYIREGISDLRIYVTVTSPYPPDRGITQILQRWSVLKAVPHRQVDQTRTHRYSRSLSLLLSLATQEIMSGYWILVLHTMCALIGIDFLVLRSRRDVQSLWAMIIHVSWKV